MGINARLEVLLRKANKSTAERLESEYLRLVSPDQMGSIFKVMYIGKQENGNIF